MNLGQKKLVRKTFPAKTEIERTDTLSLPPSGCSSNISSGFSSGSSASVVSIISVSGRPMTPSTWGQF
jgi:hypothetical protein